MLNVAGHLWVALAGLCRRRPTSMAALLPPLLRESRWNFTYCLWSQKLSPEYMPRYI